MTTLPFTLSRSNTIIDLSGETLYCGISTFGQRVDVHKHPELGNILFIDGEAQISTKDFEVYHLAMLNFVPSGSHILVVGDGDGGFTRRPDYVVTQIEPDDVVREAATLHFDADWENRKGYALHQGTLENYIDSLGIGHNHHPQSGGGLNPNPNPNPNPKFDAIFLAITDEFNADVNNFADVLTLWDALLVPGGKLVCQVGCLSDPHFHKYQANYSILYDHLSPCVGVSSSTVYIDCFHSQHLFTAFTKG